MPFPEMGTLAPAGSQYTPTLWKVATARPSLGSEPGMDPSETVMVWVEAGDEPAALLAVNDALNVPAAYVCDCGTVRSDHVMGGLPSPKTRVYVACELPSL